MKLLVLLLTVASSSSCILLGVGAATTVLAVEGERDFMAEGQALEAEYRAQRAKEADALRERYRASEAALRVASTLTPAPAPSSPPLVSVEPIRQPLRPRAR